MVDSQRALPRSRKAAKRKKKRSFFSTHTRRQRGGCLLAIDLPFQTSPATGSDVALDLALDREISSIRVVLQRNPENSFNILVSHGVGTLTLHRSLDTQSTAFFLEHGDVFAARDVVDAESAVGAGPGAREGGAEAPVGSIVYWALGEAGWITGCLIRRCWGPSDARAVLEASRGGTHAGSNSQAREDGEGLHGGKHCLWDFVLLL